MNTMKQYREFMGPNKVRKTWKHTLSPEKNAARLEQMRFCKQVRKLLGEEYQVEFHFNPGGPAVWGETYVNIFRNRKNGESPNIADVRGVVSADRFPVVEACLSVDFSYIRQWDGRSSGRNVQFNWKHGVDAGHAVQQFVGLTRELAARPFVRF